MENHVLFCPNCFLTMPALFHNYRPGIILACDLLVEYCRNKNIFLSTRNGDIDYIFKQQ